MTPFASRVADGMKRRGVTLRQLCRSVALDPSFLSKVLSGKRSPPPEDMLRKIATELELDAAELVVSAGRIPAEWLRVTDDADLFQRVHRLASGAAPAAVPRAAVSRPAPRREERPLEPRFPSKAQALSEELL